MSHDDEVATVFKKSAVWEVGKKEGRKRRKLIVMDALKGLIRVVCALCR